MACPCMVCRGISFDSLPCYAKYNQDYLQAKYTNGGLEDDEDWLCDIKNHYQIQILRAVITYGGGECMYRMYRRVNRLYFSTLEITSRNDELLLDALNNILTMSHSAAVPWAPAGRLSDGGMIIESAFDLVIPV